MLGKFGKVIKHPLNHGEETPKKSSGLNGLDDVRQPHHNSNILGYKVATLPPDIVGDLNASSASRGQVSLSTTKISKTQDDRINLDGYRKSAKVCPAGAISKCDESVKETEAISLDIGKCISCARCQDVSPELFNVTSIVARPVRLRSDLVSSSSHDIPEKRPTMGNYEALGNDLKDKIKRMFGRSLAIREVDAGSCNGCEVEITALNNPIYDIERFGIHFVASPRHADVLLVTGPASRNMEIALKRTYEATPDPKIVIAAGACACSGGIFGDTYATTGGINNIVPVDVFIPGCPPRPEALVYGLLLAVDRINPAVP